MEATKNRESEKELKQIKAEADRRLKNILYIIIEMRESWPLSETRYIDSLLWGIVTIRWLL
jgi:hypothetical protein